RQAINQAEYLGPSKATATIIPSAFDHAWSPPLYAYDPARAKKLLAEAGYPNGFDGGHINADLVYAQLAEHVANQLQTVGIRLKINPMERAAIILASKEKKLKHLHRQGSAAIGTAPTRTEAFV